MKWDGLTPAAVGQHTTRLDFRDKAPKGYGLYWAVNCHGNRGIRLDYRGKGRVGKLPNLEYLVFEEDRSSQDKYVAVFLTTGNEEMVLAFGSLADALAEAVSEAPVEKRVATFISRIRMWNHLLSAGGSFGVDQARGLYAELVALRDLVLPAMDEEQAIASWEGPSGGNHDYCCGSVDIEIKSIPAGGRKRITISSKDQLEPGGATLYLLAIEVIENKTAKGGETIADVVGAICGQIADPAVRVSFQEKVGATGCEASTLFSSMRMTAKRKTAYLIDDSFPRISASSVPSEIDEMKYRIDLSKCSRFERDLAVLSAGLMDDVQVEM